MDSGNGIPASCDVAVIGAGIGGLTSAAILAKAGLRVTVLEAQGQPGGYLCGFERKGFIFDSAIHWLNQCNPGGFVYRLFSHLGDDFPRCRSLTRICRCKGESFEYLLTTDPAKMRDDLIARFPHEEKGIRRLFEDGRKLGAHWKLLNDKIRTSVNMPFLEKLALGLRMTRWTFPLWRYVRGSVDRGLARYFRDPALKKLFARESSFMSIMMPIGWAYEGNFQVPPEGGSQAFARWLCGIIERAGSQVLLNRRVARVALDSKGRAAGVALEGGTTIESRYVVAASDLATLYGQMLPESSVPRRVKKAIQDADLYYSNFSMFIGLDCDPRTLGFDEEMFHLVREDVSRADQSSGDAHKSAITILAPSVRDPTMAPAGKGTLAIHCPAYMSHYDRWKTDEGFKRGAAYRAFKKEYADILLDRVEKALGLDLRKHIEVMETATPVTYWRYTGNKDGTSMGTSPTGRNIRARIAGYETPIPNLFLGGHWAEYGGGVPMAMKAGANAALIILQGERKSEFEKLKRVMDGHALDVATIGIPRALCYFLHPGLWETFFRELGMNVLVSNATTRATVEQAGLISESEHCLPVKMFDGHLSEIVDKVDMVFVPRIMSTLAGHIACPKLGALPDCAQAQFGEVTKILTIDIDEAKTPIEQTLTELGRQLKADEDTIRRAVQRGLEATRSEHRRTANAPLNGRPRFLVLGHPYNLYDEYMSGPILKKLAELNVNVDRVDYDVKAVPEGPIKWDACSIMYDAIRRLERPTCAGVIQLSSFNCGCDSIASEVFRGMLKEKGIPYMTLILDEHSAQAGVDTRLEAFVDSIGWDHAVTGH